LPRSAGRFAQPPARHKNTNTPVGPVLSEVEKPFCLFSNPGAAMQSKVHFSKEIGADLVVISNQIHHHFGD